MWTEIEESFEGYPAQKKVALLLLELGFQINAKGRVVCGEIEIPHSQIGKEIGVDRRVVDATVARIQKNQKLKGIFASLHSIAFLRDIAPKLGLGVVVITVEDASKPGIVGRVASEIAEHGVAIRQAIADDPYFVENPKFTVITEKVVTGKLFEDLKKIEGVKKITIY
ncbi:MAG: amino acid-binding protein [Candidatus Hydrothermarchaeales archaeon]